MKIFISWSGTQSKVVAEALQDWLKTLLQRCDPWMSSGLTSGARWQIEIARQLEEARFGILCLTRQNVRSPWLLFEAGAISKTLDTGLVCPYLIDFELSSLEDPLRQFQAVEATFDGTWQLVKAINRTLDRHSLSESLLRDLYTVMWPNLEGKIREAQSLREGAGQAGGIRLYARDTFRFRSVSGVDFGEYVRRLVTECSPGTTLKILGIDCAEIFGEGVSGVSELYAPSLREGQTQIRVILLDPRSKAAFEKRSYENQLGAKGGRKESPNHPERIYGKILSSCMIIGGYQRDFPSRLDCRFVQAVPSVSCLLNGSQVVWSLYTSCHKGWASPIFIADRSEDGIYDFFDEYFEFLWLNPDPDLPKDYEMQLQEFEKKLVKVLGALPS